jgi:two-component system response regulator AtoC
VHARIIAATNKDLKTLVAEGKFREDLYYRLNIVVITIPPLRERREDIPSLVEYLLSKINLDLHKRVLGVSDDVMEMFYRYSWPGNIRELENLLIRACVVSKGQLLQPEDFPELQERKTPEPSACREPENEFMKDGRFLTLDEMEERYIRKVLKETTKNKGAICELLGISRPTLERKLEKYGIAFERD